MTATNRLDIEIMAHRNGLDKALRLCQEECAELIKAASKYCRYRFTEANYEGLTESIAEEIADVEIMCEQIKCLLRLRGRVGFYTEYKIGRTLDKGAGRIEKA